MPKFVQAVSRFHWQCRFDSKVVGRPLVMNSRLSHDLARTHAEIDRVDQRPQDLSDNLRSPRRSDGQHGLTILENNRWAHA